MSTYAYIDATSGTSEHALQHYGILSFASNNRLGQVHFIHESASDQFHGAKPILSGMISTLQREDVLIVTDFSKLGGSTVEVLGILSTLARTGVKLYVVNSGFRLADNMQSQVVAMACSLVSQIEQQLANSKSTATSLKELPEVEALDTHVPRRRRSRLDGREEEIRSHLACGRSLSELGGLLGENRQTVKDYIISRNLSVQTPPPTT